MKGFLFMWGTFVAASLCAILVLYIPGYLFWRAFHYDRLLAFCTAPIISLGAFGSAVSAFYLAGIPANAWTISAALLVPNAAIWGASALRRRAGKTGMALAFPTGDTAGTSPPAAGDGRSTRLDWLLLAGYAFCGIVVTSVVYLASIGGPDSFFCRWDNLEHIPLIKAFLDSGNWSSLSTSFYSGFPEQALPYLDETIPEFYPATLHGLAAFACSATGASVPCGLNAVNAVFTAIVMPVSMFAFIKAAFPGNTPVHLAGVVMASACTDCPWWFFISGPLYPNFAGIALMPASAGCAIALLETGLASRKKIAVAALGCSSVIALALLHPNSLFLLFVVLVAYVASRLYRTLRETGRGGARGGIDARTVGVLAAYFLAVAVFWVACLHAQPLHNTVNYEMPAEGSLAKVILGFLWMLVAQLPFTACSIIGLVACVRKRRLWILAPATFFMVAYIFARYDPDGIGRILGGFWYKDYRRLGTCFELLLIPIASYGLGSAIAWLARRAERASSRKYARAVTSCAVAAVFFVANLTISFTVTFMGRDLDFGFKSFAEAIYNGYNPDVDHMYSSEEVEFVNEVKGIVGEDELVINQPNDGSVLAHAINDLDIYYRVCGWGGQTPSGNAIRTKLNLYASDEEVRRAVEEIGASYVLLLDYQVPYEEGVWLPQYGSPGAWTGIDSITDDTPGFEVVLAENDMRLYKIADES